MKIAVVGASNNAEKYGNQIARHLMADGHSVVPVNLHEKTILGQPVFKKVSDISGAVDIVDIVVPPEQTLKILDEVAQLKGVNIWIQPGAESDEVIKFLDEHSSDFGKIVYNHCIMTSLELEFPEAQ